MKNPIIETTDGDEADLLTETEGNDGLVEEKGTEVKGAEVGLRHSKRTIKLPERYDKYCRNQIKNRPIDRRLQTLQLLQILLGSGILNDLDSDMTCNILNAVMR